MANYVLILIGALCVVNASIISIRIYDEGNEGSTHNQLQYCNNLDCDQNCRKIGFPGGVCVNGRCKCDIIRNEFLDSHKAKKIASFEVEDCNSQACDQLCRRLGFPSGACVGDRCDCDNFKPIEQSSQVGHKVSTQIDDCNFQACDQLCRRLGFPSGACVGDRCECDDLKPKGLQYLLTNCDTMQCDRMCRSLNYAGGVCIGDSCDCY